MMSCWLAIDYLIITYIRNDKSLLFKIYFIIRTFVSIYDAFARTANRASVCPLEISCNDT